MYHICKMNSILLVVLICFTFDPINGDVDGDIRAEEERRHNSTVSEYLKAAFSGALSHIFPKVTPQELEEAEKVLADVFPIGDPSRPLAANAADIEARLCSNRKERAAKVLEYSRKRWPTQLIVQICVRLSIAAIGDKNDEYCRDAASRSVYTGNASVVNAHLSGLNAARTQYIDNVLAIIHNSNGSMLAGACCTIWSFKASIIGAVSTPESKHFITDYYMGYYGKAIKYLCIYHSEGSNACAKYSVPPVPANVARYSSPYAAGLELASRLTSITA